MRRQPKRQASIRRIRRSLRLRQLRSCPGWGCRTDLQTRRRSDPTPRCSMRHQLHRRLHSRVCCHNQLSHCLRSSYLQRGRHSFHIRYRKGMLRRYHRRMYRHRLHTHQEVLQSRHRRCSKRPRWVRTAQQYSHHRRRNQGYHLRNSRDQHRSPEQYRHSRRRRSMLRSSIRRIRHSQQPGQQGIRQRHSLLGSHLRFRQLRRRRCRRQLRHSHCTLRRRQQRCRLRK